MAGPPTTRLSLFLRKLIKLLESPNTDTLVVFVFIAAMAVGWAFLLDQIVQIVIQTRYLYYR